MLTWGWMSLLLVLSAWVTRPHLSTVKGSCVENEKGTAPEDWEVKKLADLRCREQVMRDEESARTMAKDGKDRSGIGKEGNTSDLEPLRTRDVDVKETLKPECTGGLPAEEGNCPETPPSDSPKKGDCTTSPAAQEVGELIGKLMKEE
ncbi:hypothetical protein BWQ96_10395 [Gracilariopsis chorda]|uniref:Uncharacterized protein n=1 Tax=Gracilariopsis chorda TaxID=448386 RepID=A0A2V3ICV8_9FLOR|nr:hypothetical protein BWQ96_10395 [Gracilariopsis chorda]|eukprot:PXF39922.1 hypothetical protein BWQ96_10395 [Gracilariopsis chorda]